MYAYMLILIFKKKFNINCQNIFAILHQINVTLPTADWPRFGLQSLTHSGVSSWVDSESFQSWVDSGLFWCKCRLMLSFCFFLHTFIVRVFNMTKNLILFHNICNDMVIFAGNRVVMVRL